MTTIPRLPTHAFGSFTAELLKDDAVHEALDGLQRHHGLSANILLFCCWFAESGQGQLRQREVREFLQAILPWRTGIVLPLQRLCATLLNPAWASRVRREATETERAAEEAERLMLASAIYRYPMTRTDLQRLNDACRSMAGYCRVLQIALDESDFRGLQRILMHIFPGLEPETVYERCRVAIHGRRRSRMARLLQMRLFGAA